MKLPLFAPWLLLSLGCSSSSAGPPPDDMSRFVGTWTYLPGSAIVADCSSAPEQTLDLSRMPPQDQPGFFTFSASGDASLHEVDARGCQYDWTVSGYDATAFAGQSCATFPDGMGGDRLVHLVSGTKSTTDGSTISVDVHFTTDAPSSCTIDVHGTASKS
jgi:hypothetical protein